MYIIYIYMCIYIYHIYIYIVLYKKNIFTVNIIYHTISPLKDNLFVFLPKKGLHLLQKLVDVPSGKSIIWWICREQKIPIPSSIPFKYDTSHDIYIPIDIPLPIMIATHQYPLCCYHISHNYLPSI